MSFRIFVDGTQQGMSGDVNAGWGPGQTGNGMGLSHTPSWVPLISVANVRLQKRSQPYVIEVRFRSASASGNGDVHVNGVGMTIKIFHEITICIALS
jgi:hypothetical protein